MDAVRTAAAHPQEADHVAVFRRIPDPPQVYWTALTRFAFRAVFLYFAGFLFFCGNGTILGVFPVVGNWIEDKLNWPIQHLAVWTGQKLFHLSGISATLHPTGSGDTAINWVTYGLFLAIALGGAAVWTVGARLRGTQRTEYQTLFAWLRFVIRLSLGMWMLGYGFDKVFPLQMPPISIAVLNEPIGQSSPMTLLWSLLGLSPVYQSICGAAEVLGGTLILFRRTALLGSLLIAFVATNIVLYNFAFDVPVKLFSLNILLATLFVILPDVPALFRFFLLHTPAAPRGVWIPSSERRSFRIATRAVEVIFILTFLTTTPYETYQNWKSFRASTQAASPLLGAWHIDSGSNATGAFLTSEGLPTTDLFIDSVRRAGRRATDGGLWRSGLTISEKDHTLKLNPFLADPVTYSWRMPDANHVILTSLAPKSSGPSPAGKGGPIQSAMPETIAFTRIPLPAHYPLLDRGFHFVNEFGHQR